MGQRRKRQRVADDVARVTVGGVIVATVLLLLLPLAITLSMSFDARDCVVQRRAVTRTISAGEDNTARAVRRFRELA